jgi:uncharacterized protein (DUF1015 family)
MGVSGGVAEAGTRSQSQGHDFTHEGGMGTHGLLPLFAPIRAERHRPPASLSEVIAPPYDVVSGTARETYAARSPHNIVHLTLPTGRDPYAAAATLLQEWRAGGVLERDEDPVLYVLQQEFFTPDGRSHLRTGVIGGLSAEGYASGRVRPHERTHRGPKEDRLALGRTTGTALEPIFLLARDQRGHLRRRLDGVTRHQPTETAELDGVAVGLWRIGGAQAAEVAHAVGDGPLYIADGHHRFETATALRDEVPGATHIPALVVPLGDPGLVVLPTHRVLWGSALAVDRVVAELEERFVVEAREAELDVQGLLDACGPHPAAAIALPKGRLFVLTARDPHVGALEIGVIEEHVVQPLARAAGRSARVSYTAVAGELFDAVAGEAVAGVLVRPTPAERVLAVADAGEIMPPKSTYFHPKVPSGLLLLPFDTGPTEPAV